jgi:hypothetical protein
MLIALVLAVAVVIGYLSGGRLRRLATLHLRLPWLAALGLALQLIEPPRPWPFALLVISFIVLAIFAVANARTTGFPLIVAGLALNALVISVDRGMPVTREAIVASGQEEQLDSFAARPGTKHHLARQDDRLLFLADAIAVPPPIGEVVSVGDLLAYGGAAIVVIAGMRGRLRRRAA